MSQLPNKNKSIKFPLEMYLEMYLHNLHNCLFSSNNGMF